MKLLGWTLPDVSKLSRKERLYAVGCGLAVALLVLDRFVLTPWWQHTRHVREEIRRIERSMNTFQQMLDRHPQIAAEVDAYRAYLSEQGTEASDMAAVLREIEQLGQESGLTLAGVKPQPGLITERYQDYAVEVQYRGTMEQWLHFVYLLQTSKLLFEIERSTVTLKGEEEEEVLEGALRVTGRVQAPASSA